MFRYKPFTITIVHQQEQNIQNFTLSFAKQLLLKLDIDSDSIYTTSLRNITLTGYSQQRLVIVNDLFTTSEDLGLQLSNIKLLNSTSVVQVSENKYKEPIFFKSNIIIINTSNLYPHSKNNYNYLVNNSDICLKYIIENKKFYIQKSIIEPDISLVNTNLYYQYLFERDYSYYYVNNIITKQDKGITIENLLNVSYDTYISYDRRCTKDRKVTSDD